MERASAPPVNPGGLATSNWADEVARAELARKTSMEAIADQCKKDPLAVSTCIASAEPGDIVAAVMRLPFAKRQAVLNGLMSDLRNADMTRRGAAALPRPRAPATDGKKATPSADGGKKGLPPTKLADLLKVPNSSSTRKYDVAGLANILKALREKYGEAVDPKKGGVPPWDVTSPLTEAERTALEGWQLLRAKWPKTEPPKKGGAGGAAGPDKDLRLENPFSNPTGNAGSGQHAAMVSSLDLSTLQPKGDGTD